MKKESRHIIFRPYVKVYYSELDGMEHRFSCEYRNKFHYDHVYLHYGHVKYFLDSNEVYGFITIRKKEYTDKLKQKLIKYIPYNFTIKPSIDEENELSLVFTGEEFRRLYEDLTKHTNEIYEKTLQYKLISPTDEKYHDLEHNVFYKVLKEQRSGIDYIKFYSYSPDKVDIHVLVVGLSNKTEKYKTRLQEYITNKLNLEDYESVYYNPNTSLDFNRINVLYYKDVDINRMYDLLTLMKMKGV